MCWLTLCEVGRRHGPAFASTCVTCPKRRGRNKKPPILMMIQHGNGVSGTRRGNQRSNSAPVRENRCQLLRWNHFKLRISTIDRLLVGSPSAELCHMAEAAPLHVLVSDFHYQFGTQRLPGQVLALTPAALATRHPLDALIRRYF